MKSLLAATIDLGPIQGIGKYQEDVATVEKASSGLEGFISTLVAVLTVVAGLAFLIYFTLGALSWITAGGDKQKTDTAQKQMTNAAIGLIATIVAYFIAAIVGTVLNIDILNPAQILFR